MRDHDGRSVSESTGEKAKSAAPEWFGGLSTPEVSQTPLLASAYPSRMLSFMPIPGHLKRMCGELRALLGRELRKPRSNKAPRALPLS